MIRSIVTHMLALSIACFCGFQSFATFHFMQIEKIITCVNGDTANQAIQLRSRTTDQNLVSGASLIAYDANGANPVTLITFGANVTNDASGATILITTANFGSLITPALNPDFTMTNRIPDAYLSAGRLTYEGGGQIYWSVSWGGVAYIGSNTGSTTNDTDGNFGPAWPTSLVSASTYPDATHALAFDGLSTALSVANSTDYSLAGAEPTVTTNSGATGTVDGGTRSITVTQPTQSTSVSANQRVAIRWTTTGNLSSKVRIDLFKGSNKITTITTNTKNDGKFRWTVPNGLESDNSYRIRVLNKATATGDKSAKFTISP